MSDSKGAAIQDILINYRSQIASAIRNEDDGEPITTTMLKKIDGAAHKAILAILAQEVDKARLEEVENFITPGFKGGKHYCDGPYCYEYAAERLNELRAIRKAGLV